MHHKKTFNQWIRTSVLIVAAAMAHRATGADRNPVSFSRDIRPILSDYCFACHGPDGKHRKGGTKKSGGLRLDTKEGAFAEHDGIAAIVAGDAENSELVYRITSDDKKERMPPDKFGKTLSDKQKKLLSDWIKKGAPWEEHWSFQPVTGRRLPTVKDTKWPANFIDRFVLAKMEAVGVSPSPRAEKRTLIRRVTFDIIGLPPTPEEVEAFVNDTSKDAYKKLIDRLLKSPHFGERLAIYWLDLVRYADTVGYHGDQDHNASPYRDWVIDAFNQNMPYDQFTIAQLAGDLVAAKSNNLTESDKIDLKVASAYNRLLQTSHEGGVQVKEYLAIYAADRVRNVSAVWMGSTVGCAQCHDHKYDPFTAKDHYALAAFFADVDEAAHFKNGSNSLPTRRDPEMLVVPKQHRAEWTALTAKISRLNASIKNLKGKTQQLKTSQGLLNNAKKRLAEINRLARKCMTTVSVKPRTMRILPRGNWLDDSGEIVQPAIPEFLGKLNVNGRATRLDLANWIASPKNPLTARTFVNRLWALYFGRGISPDLLDLGGQGQPPTHPELLDALAIEFVKQKWNIKQMVRLIVMSNAYQQTSKATQSAYQRDPPNTLYARQAKRRLDAEMIRDNYLAVSGLLVREVGGHSANPYQPAGYYQHLNFPTRRYAPSKDGNQWRRGVYVHWQRQFLHPMLRAFDAPTREECTAQRPTSNTPLAALTMLNDPSAVEAARVFAETIIKRSKTDATRLAWAFEKAMTRKLKSAEMQLLKTLLANRRAHYKTNVDEAQALLSVGIAPRDKAIDSAELAAWTGIARVLFNTDEFITRD